MALFEDRNWVSQGSLRTWVSTSLCVVTTEGEMLLESSAQGWLPGEGHCLQARSGPEVLNTYPKANGAKQQLLSPAHHAEPRP